MTLTLVYVIKIMTLNDLEKIFKLLLFNFLINNVRKLKFSQDHDLDNIYQGQSNWKTPLNYIFIYFIEAIE